MQHIIALPKKISFVPGDVLNQGQVIVEPLAPGYGTTVGNALRRVLLASLPGIAVIGAKIEGASHEFMAIPNVKEDVLEIMLNLKKIRFKLDEGVDEVRLTLSAFGEKEVTAKDVEKQAGVQVVNPDLVIAHITDMSGKLNMEIFVRRGFGYETIESREEGKKELGYIEIDSIFSPVLHVSLAIQNVRVGKMVNWEKLVLDMETDGTVSFEDAFRYANDTLIDQFTGLKEISNNPVADLTEEVAEPAEAMTEEVAAEEVVADETEEAPVAKVKKSKKI
ncbi:MAG: DNA-directed RNA polymerase subunit alpha [Candidatus Falkowbacteria bacterium]|nr:DNA-directed RNA polymerase subunit alpha [Candidatus Falkowbacteria bacterium]